MKKVRIKLWRRLFVFFSALLAVLLVLSNAANTKQSAIITVLGGETYKVVKGDSSDEDTEYFKREYTSQDALQEYMDGIGRETESEGIVLLRNETLESGEKALPLAKDSRVSLFGQGSVKFNYSSTGSSANMETSSYPNLKNALSDLNVNESLWNFYLTGPAKDYKREYSVTRGYQVNEAPWSLYSSVESSFTQYGDAAIYVISRDSGEGKDISTQGSDGTDGSYLSLTAQEREVLQQISAAKKRGTFSCVIVLLNSAVPVQLDFMFDDSITVDAALWVGNVGATGIYAINDVLVGTVVPSGRLSDTYAKDNFSSPAMATWAANPDKSFSRRYTNTADYPSLDKDVQTVYAVYNEGIYVGYRYYETRYADSVTGAEKVGDYDYDKDVAFPFGYGLSYSEFWYSDLSVKDGANEADLDNDKYYVSVNVLNAGEYAAKEVVQVYLQKPYTDYDKDPSHLVEKSAVELVGFAKVSLKSGQDKTVTVEVEKERFKSYDTYGKGTYILENGDYYLTVADNAHDAVNNILVEQGNTVEGKSYDDAHAMTYKATVRSATASDGVDAETYAYSDVNEGVKIENQFDFSDINRYEGKGSNSVTYVSRSNWAGTFPTQSAALSLTDKMAEDLKSYKALQEDGSQMPSYEEENGLQIAMLRGLAYNDPVWDDLLDQMSFGDQAYLITNGQHNTVALPSVGKPATKDENGPNGVTGSTTKTSLPSEGIWASTFNCKLIEMIGKALGEDALAAGITGIYAPGVNLHRTPFGGRAHEYFSEDPYLMSMASVAETKGIQSKGVWAYVKHFAVNDEETNRAGVSVWLNEQEMREIVLLPFEYTVKPAWGNAHAMMTSFNRIGCIWTSASSALMEKVLRDEWGFDGFAVTDMASSNAQSFMTFVDGIANGTDCYDGSGSETALNDYKDSAMFANKMRESAHRILYVTANYSAAMNGISSSDTIVRVMPWWQIVIVVIDVAVAAFAVWSMVMLIISYVKKLKGDR
jgi:beta-glucosidase